MVGRITARPGNWRYAAENGFDEAHAKYLHRYESAVDRVQADARAGAPAR